MTLLGHYWRDDDPVKLTAAIGADWAEVLEGIPQEYIHRACIQYQRNEPRRKPTPGAIYKLAISMMPKPKPAPKQITAPRRRVTAEQVRAIMAEYRNPDDGEAAHAEAAKNQTHA